MLLVDGSELSGVSVQPRRYFLGAQEEVGQRAGRVDHRRALRALLRTALGDREPAPLLESRYAERSVARCAIQHDAHRPVILVFGERDEEGVDRAAKPWLFLRGPQPEAPLLDREQQVGVRVRRIYPDSELERRCAILRHGR